jgi:hypothetical protein
VEREGTGGCGRFCKGGLLGEGRRGAVAAAGGEKGLRLLPLLRRLLLTTKIHRALAPTSVPCGTNLPKYGVLNSGRRRVLQNHMCQYRSRGKEKEKIRDRVRAGMRCDLEVPYPRTSLEAKCRGPAREQKHVRLPFEAVVATTTSLSESQVPRNFTSLHFAKLLHKLNA